MRAERELACGGLKHLGVVVSQQEGAVAHHVVDVLVSVHVPFVGALRSFHIQRKGREVADVVGDAVREQLCRSSVEKLRGGMELLEAL